MVKLKTFGGNSAKPKVVNNSDDMLVKIFNKGKKIWCGHTPAKKCEDVSNED